MHQHLQCWHRHKAQLHHLSKDLWLCTKKSGYNSHFFLTIQVSTQLFFYLSKWCATTDEYSTQLIKDGNTSGSWSGYLCVQLKETERKISCSSDKDCGSVNTLWVIPHKFPLWLQVCHVCTPVFSTPMEPIIFLRSSTSSVLIVYFCCHRGKLHYYLREFSAPEVGKLVLTEASTHHCNTSK